MNLKEVKTYLLASLAGIFITLLAFPVYAENDYDCEYNGGCEEPPEPPPFEEGDTVEVCVDGSCNIEFYSEIDVEAGSAIRRSANNDFYSEIDVEGSGDNEFSSEITVEGGDVDADGGNAFQFQKQSGVNEQGQETDVIVEVEINNPAADVAKAAKRAARRAAQAARVTAGSNGGTTPCGDHTGLSISTGAVGGGLGTITEACRAYRVTQAEALVSGKKGFAVKAQYWIGFPFRLALHVCTLGVLN